MSTYALILNAHIGAGAIALLTYWTAALARKGSRWHRLAGRVFLLAMIVVVLTGLPLALKAWLAGHRPVALFLAFLLLLVGSGMGSAWRAVRWRHDFGRYTGRLFHVQAWSLVLAGAGIAAMGLAIGQVIFAVFGSVALVAGGSSLRLAARGPADGRWWLREHYGAMIGNGAATHIAFLGIGLRGSLPGIDPVVQQHLAWLLPVAVAVLAGLWLDRRYARSSPSPSPSERVRRSSTT
jgi:hypothetical protein